MPEMAEHSMAPLPYGLKDRDYEHYDMPDMAYNIEAIYGSPEEKLMESLLENAQEQITKSFGVPMESLGRFKLRPATTPPESGMCIALYGTPGVGKTTLAAQAALSPLGSPVIIIDAEGGTRAVAHMDNVQVPEGIRTWKDIIDISDILARGGHPFKTVVLDNMSEFQSWNMKSIVGDKLPQIQDWGRNTNELLNFSRLWRDISRDTGVNVIFIAWESPEEDSSSGVKIIKRDLGFTPSLAKQFPGLIDIVGHLTVNPSGLRVLNFSPSNRSAAKFRRSQTEVAMQIPLQLTYGLNEFPMVDLLNTLKGGEPWPKGKYVKSTVATQQSN